MTCPHLENGKCAIASRLAGRAVTPWENVCEACSSCTAPQSENYVTASIACQAWTRDAGDRQATARLKEEFAELGLFEIGRDIKDLFALGEGPGTLLHDRLAGMGFEVTPTCPCLYWIRFMNANGTAGTKRHEDEIVDAMLAEFRKRKPVTSQLVPNKALRTIAIRLIRQACREWDRMQVAECPPSQNITMEGQ